LRHNTSDLHELEFKSNNLGFVALGTLLLWVGWYGFNSGMLLSIYSKDSFIIPYICFTTTLSAAGGGLIAGVFIFLIDRVQSIIGISNGILAGLVSISAGCSQVLPSVSIFIGAVGALI